MKKLLTLFLAFSCVLSLFGCGALSENSLSNNTAFPKPTVPFEAIEPTVPSEPNPTDPETPTDPNDPDTPVKPIAPAMPTTWIANCNDYINFRIAPESTLICTIPKGASMELLSWNETYARVKYNGQTGYVLSSYIMPADENYFTQCLNVVEWTNLYTYEQMVEDMATLASKHPDIVTVSSIGTSELGRDIPVIRIGNENAKDHVLFQGAMHAREYLTSWLLMAMTEYWLTYDLLQFGDACYHIIPMTNPDGVTLAQTKTLTPEQKEIYLSDKANGYTSKNESAYASSWKANGVGVDLNRNFESGWELLDDQENDHDAPSSEFYEGTAPFSAAEAAALRDYTLKYRDKLSATISYHSSGSVIYYEYGNKEPVNSDSLDLAVAVQKDTGYLPMNSTTVSGAGYKDWVMDALEIPSITIEIGVGDSPLEMREIYSIFVRNLQVFPTVAKWVQNQAA